jgi:hypothetical protein
MTCKNCECDECIDALDKEYQQQEKEKYKSWCEGWNYNAHPIEIAKELKEDHGFNDIAEEDFQKFLEVFGDYFGNSSRDNLEETCDYIF